MGLFKYLEDLAALGFPPVLRSSHYLWTEYELPSSSPAIATTPYRLIPGCSLIYITHWTPVGC